MKKILIIGASFGLFLFSLIVIEAEYTSSSRSALTMSNVEALAQYSEGGSGEKVYLPAPQSCTAPSEIYIISPGNSIYHAGDWISYTIQMVDYLEICKAEFTVYPEGPGRLVNCERGSKVCIPSDCHHILVN